VARLDVQSSDIVEKLPLTLKFGLSRLGNESLIGKCFQSNMLILWQVKVLLISLSVSDHANLQLHLLNSGVTDASLLPLNLCFSPQLLDLLEQQFAVVPLLTNIILHLLVVSVDLRLHIHINLLDLLAQLAHQLIHFAS